MDNAFSEFCGSSAYEPGTLGGTLSWIKDDVECREVCSEAHVVGKKYKSGDKASVVSADREAFNYQVRTKLGSTLMLPSVEKEDVITDYFLQFLQSMF